MKKLFLLAAMVGVALTGCMKNEVYVPKCETPISFEVANYVAQTRAEGAFDTTKTFGVNAWSHDVAGTEVQMMTNETIAYADGKWTTATPYYWPINGTVDFIAYYPTSVVPEIVYDYDGDDTYTYDNYTVTDVDLMYADKAVRFSANVNTYGFDGVPTLFHHALAKVNFQVKNAYPAETATGANTTYEIVVNSITLNTHHKGSVTLENDGTNDASRGTWSVANNVWTPAEGSTTPLTWEDDVNLDDDSVVAYDEKTQYVLPQILADDVTVEVVYTVTQKQDGTIISVKEYTPAAIKLNTMGLTSWEMNKNITYTISIIAKSNQIFFDPAVEEWATATGATTIE
ncbi:MAG: fimbrillin family protein [Alistipes sp.]|nr:fimbrillin family protein [Alistipes sp.]